MSEVQFDVTHEGPGGYAAECVSENMSVMASNWEELRCNVKAAVEKHFHDGPKPASIRLHLVHDEVTPLSEVGLSSGRESSAAIVAVHSPY